MQRFITHSIQSPARRGGAVIVVVLALLTSLMFIGLFFYKLGDSELSVATAFAQGPSQVIDPDVPMDFALQQIIVSTPESAQQSALSGGQVTSGPDTLQVSDKSLLAHVLGLIAANGEPADVRPRNGRGIGVYGTGTNATTGLPQASSAAEVGFDVNGDGTIDYTGANFRINLSSMANDGAPNYGNPFERSGNEYADSRPDVDYTYPDINSLFLAYESTIISGGNTYRIVIPSYFRPQLFPDERSSGFGNIFTDTDTAKQVLRPHLEHFNSDGTTRRYLNAAAGTSAQSGDRNRLIGPFPMTVGSANQMGVFNVPANVNTPYELDVDADGDGILDSIWLDLDPAIIDLADGRQAVPMFYAKIIDADALLNVNYHGQDPLITALSNEGQLDVFDHIYQLGNNGWIHASNQGLSVSEVNPEIALYADPTDTAFIAAGDVDAATKQHQGWYSAINTTSGFTRISMANTELARLLHGAPQYLHDLSGFASPFHIPGRYGEVGILETALSGPGTRIPSAGDTNLDDDNDDGDLTNNYAGGPEDNIATGVAHQDDFGALLAPPLTIPPSVHPLDFSGLGNYSIASLYPSLALPYGQSYRVGTIGVGGIRDLGHNSLVPTNPSRWLLYGTQTAPLTYQAALWSSQDNGTFPVFGISPWTQGANPGDLQVSQLPLGTRFDGLDNEADEIVTDGNFPTQVDEPFPPSEMAALHLSDQQWQLIRENSRLRKLVSVNFDANHQAQAIRRQFTTDSRDRLEHGHTRPLNTNRQWEFNDVDPISTLNRFPPAFDPSGTPIRSAHENLSINPIDPFRPVTRRLLAVEEGNTSNIGAARSLPGQRLNINRLLVNFDRYGNPIYRHLTPHVTFQLADGTNPSYNPLYLADGTPQGVRPVDHQHPSYTQAYYDDGQALALLDPDIPTNGTYPAVPFSAVSSDPFAQEVWARYDRQRLARDIYTLLYIVGAPDEIDDGTGTAVPFNPTTMPYTGADANTNGIVDTVEAIAQFAVNYVDALDHDDCITRFEFDPDLSNGWDAPNSVVLGVEAQQLALSEVLLVQQPSAMTDNDGTLHNESLPNNTEHRWLHVELRNASPFIVPLQTGSYRLARYAEAETLRTGVATPVAASMFTTTTTNAYKQVGSGENFIVACHDGTVTNGAGMALTSDIYANIDDTITGLECIVPENATTVASPNDDPTMTSTAPHADLDLIVTDTMVPAYSEFYDNTIAAPGGVALVEPDTSGTGTQLRFQLRLERRLNTHGFNFGENDQTWVEVDRIVVEGKTFAPGGNTATDMQSALAGANSTERRQPFDEFQVDFNDTTVVRRHSMYAEGGANPPAKHTGNYAWGTANGGDRTAGFTLWQPHFNRDFASVYELLSIPMVGPERLVATIADENNKRLSGWIDSSSGTPPYVAFAAAGIFLHPNGQTQDSVSTMDDNRWYRLFEFLEFPPRTQDTIKEGLTVRRRTDGRINLNTLRHEHVYAGMIDDLIQLQNTSATRPTIDQHDGSRNWFDQLLIARDGMDPLSNLPLPGVPGAMPFRSLSYMDPQPNTDPVPLASPPDQLDNQLQNTIMRLHHPYGLTLMDPAMENESLLAARGPNDVGNDAVDYHTRNRLLAKIANNSTNRSHIFAMWVGYELFEAHQPNASNPDIVQIGARIEDLPGHREFVVVDMSRLEEAWVDDPTTADAGRFDFRKFIIYRKRIK